MTTSRRPLSKAEFAVKVDRWVEAAIREGATGFAELLGVLPGVYPTELLKSLERLADRQAIDTVIAASVHQQATIEGTAVVEGRSLLPPPHPLDFEWRFTPDTARLLLNHATEVTPTGGDVLLFGTPGVAVEALTLPVHRRVTVLAEKNSVTERLISLNQATGSPLHIAFCGAGLPRESADAVLVDPPWYLDFMRPMLAAAAYACRPNGKVLISFPPDGARRSAESDRRSVIAFARRLGLILFEQRQLTIAYETPFFERNALISTGIFPPPQWRRGDLFVFSKVGESMRPPPASLASDRIWTEVDIGRMRLFIRLGGKVSSGEPGLTSLVDGDILPTVRRRDPRRRHANIWTSGNRIFRTNNPQLVLEAAISCTGQAMAPGIQHRLWGNIRERETLEQIGAELCALAALEAREEGGAPTIIAKRSAGWKSGLANCWNRSTAIVSG